MCDLSKKDRLVHKKAWKFDESVSGVFSDMLARSIPDYETMRSLTFRVAKKFVKSGTAVLDVGCSTGLSSKRLVEYCRLKKMNVHFELTDVSEPMLRRCRRVFEGCRNVSVLKKDVTRDDMGRGFSVVIACLTLQFIPIEYRQKVIEGIYNSLEEGGAFIWIEKVLGNSSIIDKVMVEEYYDIKRENSYTEEQIASKRKSLEGKLVPLTEKMNESLLVTAGFKRFDTFWRYLNFCGFVAVK